MFFWKLFLVIQNNKIVVFIEQLISFLKKQTINRPDLKRVSAALHHFNVVVKGITCNKRNPRKEQATAG